MTYEVAEVPPVPVEESTSAARCSPSRRCRRTRTRTQEPEIHTETTEIESLLSVDGIRFIFSSFVNNFANFSVVAVIFVAMIGVGVAEDAGLMGALIRKLVAVAPARVAHLHHHPHRRALQRRDRRRAT